ncbi:MAG: hypothetical protein UW80_C0013G0015 [Microgenomates group bacterium GW2011_GWC1_44_9]|nr:MAG: hypothetical protein UW80_C0013G0015 [Microgenomates group bacterium GW2011_GWC1_44_9]
MTSIHALKAIFLVLALAVFSIGSTNASYSDIESSASNSFSSGSVDLSLSDALLDFGGFVPGFSESQSVTLSNLGSLDQNYQAAISQTGGDTTFCNALGIDFSTAQSLLVSGNSINFPVQVSFTDHSPSLQNKSCEFDITFSAWQVGSDGAWGLRDVEVLSLTLSSGSWDESPPVISGINHLLATPGESNRPVATITWNTDELATSNLKWRIAGSSSWTFLSDDASADSLSHSRTIEGLLPDTNYQFRVISKDASGNERTSATKAFHTDGIRDEISGLSGVVINEFLPNPKGPENALRPGGEWIELYNNGTDTVYLMGWYLEDGQGHGLTLTNINTTHESIAPHGFAVVYRNGNPSFSLKNTAAGDTLSLFDHVGTLQDFHIYSAALGDSVIENKSFARYPDGSPTWFDPIPTPGDNNILDPILDFWITSNRNFVGFNLKNIQPFTALSYDLVYGTDGADQGLDGSDLLDHQDEYIKENLILGSRTTGGTPTYHQGIHNLQLTVTLSNSEGLELVLEKSLE